MCTTLTFHTYRIEPIDPVIAKKISRNIPQNVLFYVLFVCLFVMNSRTVLNIKKNNCPRGCEKINEKGGRVGGRGLYSFHQHLKIVCTTLG
jgi:hypothetical protein